MYYHLLTLRLLHIVSGVIWAGAAFTLSVFILPTISALGADGGKMMQQFVKTNRYPLVMTIAATTNVLSGIFLYWHLSDGCNLEWMSTHYGMCLTIGGIVAIIAYTIGLLINRPGGIRMEKIAKEIAAGGGKPTPEQIQEMTAIKNRLTMSSKYISYLLLFAVAMMAIARYC